MSVAHEQRTTQQHPCRICGGYDRMPRGEGKRCYGFLSDDQLYAHCSREELAGALPLTAGSETYAHRLEGPCRCGETHTERPVLSIVTTVREPRAEITATYDYRDESGDLLFQVQRRADKTFTQRRPDPDGKDGWVYSLGDRRRVLYRLPDLLAADPGRRVLILEGEKDVDRAWSLGYVATCNPHGAGKWRPEFNETLRGRPVVVIPDIDDAQTNPPQRGQKHARQIVASLSGIASAVAYVELPQHDFSDWADAGGTREQLAALCTGAAAAAPMPRIMTVQELLARAFPTPRYAVERVLQDGCTLLAGKPKTGKSWLLLHLSLAVAHGGYALGSLKADAGDVLYLALEDGPRRVQGRLIKLLQGQAPPRGLHIATDWSRLDAGGLDELDAWIAAHPNTRLVVIDTLAKIRSRGNEKDTSYRQDYESIAPLTELSHKYNIAIVVVHHTRKADAEDVMDTVSGTTGLTGAVDAMIVITRPRFGAEATMAVTGRDIDEHEMSLKWDATTAMWSFAGDARVVREATTRDVLLKTIREAPYPLRIKEVADQTGIDYNTVKQRLWQMAQAGDLFASEGKYGIVRNRRNFVTVPEEKHGYDAHSPVTVTVQTAPGIPVSEGAWPSPPSVDPPVTQKVTTDFRKSGVPPEENLSDGYEVTTVTTTAQTQRNRSPGVCSGCGYTVSRAVLTPSGEHAVICGRCGVPWPPGTALPPPGPVVDAWLAYGDGSAF